MEIQLKTTILNILMPNLVLCTYSNNCIHSQCLFVIFHICQSDAGAAPSLTQNNLMLILKLLDVVAHTDLITF